MPRKVRPYIWPVLTAIAVAGVWVGRGQYQIVNQWAHTLCTSCIGLGR